MLAAKRHCAEVAGMNIDSISDLPRAQIEAAARKRQQALDLKAEQAAGVGQPDDDEFKAEDRQADGRLPWQVPESAAGPSEATESNANQIPDAVNGRGLNLDLTA
jgi:hypothetical protein